MVEGGRVEEVADARTGGGAEEGEADAEDAEGEEAADEGDDGRDRAEEGAVGDVAEVGFVDEDVGANNTAEEADGTAREEEGGLDPPSSCRLYWSSGGVLFNSLYTK